MKRVFISVIVLLVIIVGIVTYFAINVQTQQAAEQAFNDVKVTVKSKDYDKAQEALTGYIEKNEGSKYIDEAKVLLETVNLAVIEQDYVAVKALADKNDYVKAQSELERFISKYPNSQYVNEANTLLITVKDRAAIQAFDAIKSTIDAKNYIKAQIDLESYINNYHDSSCIEEARTLMKMVNIEAELIKAEQKAEADRIAAEEKAEEERIAAEKAKKTEEPETSSRNKDIDLVDDYIKKVNQGDMVIIGTSKINWNEAVALLVEGDNKSLKSMYNDGKIFFVDTDTTYTILSEEFSIMKKRLRADTIVELLGGLVNRNDSLKCMIIISNSKRKLI